MNEYLLNDIEKNVNEMQSHIHKLAGHPIYGHFLGSKNNEISSLLRRICDNLILIQQDIKIFKTMDGNKNGK